jgi:lysophospholipase L1-like esterase
MKYKKKRTFLSIIFMVMAVVSWSCGGGGGGEEDTGTDDAPGPDTPDDGRDPAAEEDIEHDNAEDPASDPTEDMPPDTEQDVSEDTPGDADEDGTPGIVDELGTNNQDITGIERVIFLGDSITATPYLTSPWSDRIRDDLQTLFGSGVEILNLAAWGARTEHVRDDQLPRIDTASTKRTLVMMTIGGNDALQVIGEPADVSLAHMEEKVAILEEILAWLVDPAHFPGGVAVIFANLYDPTDGEGDFTHCGIGVSYEDWPALPEVEPVANGWYLDLAMEYDVDMLDMHGLFLGHGYNNTDTSNPNYCRGCTPDCPCPRWFDLSCIHPSSDGHEALAGFFLGMITR